MCAYNKMDNQLTPFILEFMSPQNLGRVRDIMTTQLQAATRNDMVQLVQMTPALHGSAMDVAVQYRGVTPTPAVLDHANHVFAGTMLSQNETRYNETAFWRRWCSQGIPDPNNILLALPP